MRSFNKDGSEGRMAGNNLRCIGKYLYDKGIVRKETMTIETAESVHTVRVYTNNGKVGTVSVDVGPVQWHPSAIPMIAAGEEAVNMPYGKYRITCLSVGNPHCVIFDKAIDGIDLETEGSALEYAEIFPDRTNVEFVRVVDACTLRIRVWERSNGATLACGTGACAAAAAAVRLGYCAKDTDIKVKLPGGDMIVRVSDDGLTLTGGASIVYSGVFEL
jgi:carbamoyl-phosphate synthase large subunit